MFPERLRQLRKRRNITLKTLASALNKMKDEENKINTPAQIGNWERGDRTPSYKEVYKLSEYFKVSLDYLVGRTKNEKIELDVLFLSGKEIDFNGIPLNDQERFDIYKQINMYLSNKNNNFLINNDDIKIDHQENLF